MIFVTIGSMFPFDRMIRAMDAWAAEAAGDEEILAIVRRERPEVVVTTGAAPGLVALVVAKLVCGSRTVWIDTVANSERMTLSGKLARPVADAWLVQWPHLAKAGGPEFWGAVL